MAGPGGEILFIAHRVPYPPDRGDKIRSWHELKHLAGIAPVHLAALADDARDLGHGAVLDQVTASHMIQRRGILKPLAALRGLMAGDPLSVALFRNRQLQAYVDHVVATRPLAAVFVYSGQMAGYVPALPRATRFIMDFCDADSRKFAAYGQEQGGPMGWIYRREGRLLGEYERDASERAHQSLFISDAEADLFAATTAHETARIEVIENGVDLSFFDPASAPAMPEVMARVPGPRLIFTGQMDYLPNIDAVTDFALDAMPVIRRHHPDAHFFIVGRKPTAEVRALGQEPGVVVTGEVADVRGFLAAADVVVAPLRIARGIQNKVLEAMAMGRPVVASSLAAEGIDALDRRDFLVAHGPAQEPALVLGLLADPGHAAQMGAAARRRVEERYGWDATLARLGPLVLGSHG